MAQFIAESARAASLLLSSASSQAKNDALMAIRGSLASHENSILAANELDMQNASKKVQDGTLSSSLFKRLSLDKTKFITLLNGIDQVIALPDPNGRVTLAKALDTDLSLYRVSCPVGVCLIIFEARPEVIVQIASLTLKSGNAAILKGGSEASHTNLALYAAIREALVGLDIPENSVQLVSTRDEISELLKQDECIDLVIPRGSNALVKSIQSSTRIPVLGHADGICSIYIDKDADLVKAIRVVTDSKVNYPAACNAVETLLIHHDVVKSHLRPVLDDLFENIVEVRLHCDLFQHLGGFRHSQLIEAKPQDFDTEFLSLTIAVKGVSSMDEAMAHVNLHGSGHTDCIITENKESATLYMNRIDSAGVYWNASTRFADGFRYGFGAEIGVSTNKTHARGPVGLEGLMIYKYRVIGNGNIVAEYNSGQRSYQWTDLLP